MSKEAHSCGLGYGTNVGQLRCVLWEGVTFITGGQNSTPDPYQITYIQEVMYIFFSINMIVAVISRVKAPHTTPAEAIHGTISVMPFLLFNLKHLVHLFLP